MSMYSDQIAPPPQTLEPVRPRTAKALRLPMPPVAAVVAAVILATAVVLAITLSGTSRIHTAFHRVPAGARSLPPATPPLVPQGYVRVPTTHQLIPIHTTAKR